jgi:hypothetical protein
MIGKVFGEQVVEVLSIPHTARGAVSAHEPALSGDPAPAVELEHEEVLQALVDPLP